MPLIDEGVGTDPLQRSHGRPDRVLARGQFAEAIDLAASPAKVVIASVQPVIRVRSSAVPPISAANAATSR